LTYVSTFAFESIYLPWLCQTEVPNYLSLPKSPTANKQHG